MKNIIKGLTLALPFALLSCGPVSSDVEQETEKRVEVSCAKLSRKKSKESVDEINDLKLLFELAKGGDTPSCVAIAKQLPRMTLYNKPDEICKVERLAREWMLYALAEDDPHAAILCYRYPLTYGVFEAGYTIEDLRRKAEAAQEELRKIPSPLRTLIDKQSLYIILP